LIAIKTDSNNSPGYTFCERGEREVMAGLISQKFNDNDFKNQSLTKPRFKSNASMHANRWRLDSPQFNLNYPLMSKLAYLQGLRGVAAFMVVLHHLTCAFYPAAIFASGPVHGQWERLVWTTPLGVLVSGHAAVCLFFVLSGYVLSLPYFGAGAKDTTQLCAAMVKRPFRLVGLVAFTMLASMVLLRANGYFDTQAAAITGSDWLKNQPYPVGGFARYAKDLITNPFWAGARYNQPLWTISYELAGSYLTFVFVLLFRSSPIRWWAYAVIAIVFSDSFYGGFVLGILLADISKNFPPLIARANRGWVVLPLLLSGIYFSAFPEFIDPGQKQFTWFSLLPWLLFNSRYLMFGAFCLFCVVLIIPWFQRIFSLSSIVYLGRVSFALYAVHLVVIRSFSMWLFLKLSPHFSYNQSVVLVMVCSILVFLVVAHMLTAWFDEIVIRQSDRIAEWWLACNQSKAISVCAQPNV
jgi:peptidoglycan/LPS O-acetylase OafA/YrhL